MYISDTKKIIINKLTKKKKFSNCQFTDFTVNSKMTCSFSESLNLTVFYCVFYIILLLIFRFITVYSPKSEGTFSTVHQLYVCILIDFYHYNYNNFYGVYLANALRSTHTFTHMFLYFRPYIAE